MKVARDKECKILNETNVHWADKIPYGWQVLRIQDFATVNDDLIKERKFRNQQIKYVDISGVNAYENTYLYEIQRFDDAPSRARRLVKSGDTVFSTVRPYLKAIATVVNPEKSLIFSTGFAVIRPGEGTDYRFIGYLLRDEMFVNRVAANSVGASYPAINASDLIKLHVLIPPLPEQRAIANFLDEKCARIDEAVRIKERQIELLRERRQILIQKAVTRGLNPDAPMKDSGVDWIGQIPAHWEIRRGKWLFNKMNRPVRKIDEIVTCFRDGIVTLRANRRVEGFTNAIKEHGYQGVRVGDLVIHAMDAFAGAIGVSDSNGKSTPVYSVCVPRYKNLVLAQYYSLYLRQIALSGFLVAIAKGIRQRSTDFRFNDFANLELALPPLKEQKSIVLFVEEQFSKIEAVITTKQSQVTALKEYKTVLINAAVTGKIRVTEE